MEDKDTILQNYLSIIRQLTAKLDSMGLRPGELSNQFSSIKLSGIGFAFPGPFDYQNGISLMKGLNKFDHLYGVNLRDELTAAIREDILLKESFHQNFTLRFLNDGDLFALGEYLAGSAKASLRTFCICIGTGIGSSFLEKGNLVKKAPNVPKYGWIYHTPYEDGIVDDYISARGILSLSKNYPSLKSVMEVKQLSDVANSGSIAALEVFREFGRQLKEVLLPFIEAYQPDTLVIGGQIAKSFLLFGDEITVECGNRGITLSVSTNTSEAILKGVAGLFKED
jgi:glucokinase